MRAFRFRRTDFQIFILLCEADKDIRQLRPFELDLAECIITRHHWAVQLPFVSPPAVMKPARATIPPRCVCGILTLTVLKLAASSSLLTTAESKLR